MKANNTHLLCTTTALLSLAFLSACKINPIASAASSTDHLAHVTGITDGNIIKVDLDGTTEHIRLIGISTPPGTSCYTQEATNRIRRFIEATAVRLETDPTYSNRDPQGHLLRHIFTSDGTNVAQNLINDGYVHAATTKPPYRYQPAYTAAQKEAQKAQRGLWAACTTTPNQPK
ncbi:thermonuclease family protein [Dermatophilus congolensis]|uniref:thermonuclease family protein n=1 Tax=Dermatophilus congolensis TaxID=1863 RepID=UPI001AAFA730|nr:thermonuclease family protein [Dermatophilus congolensis]MBO3153019.1 thermonuclease family protein [Dermatophilus congolensis]MBO3159962.1 thermonuclease family protein [Dermatophilus congolensis]MBO3164310.1 thermonuclease family protein [Dermatophilus congolensis]MBO3177859.1 thermonuclease family protein [Dermatophilus congolensis]